MTKDPRKNLDFGYNFLNLLQEVKTGSTLKAKYTWLADGSKVSVRDASGNNGYDCLGSLTLVKNGSTTTPEAAFAEGVIRGTEVMFFEKDHLGSVRAVVNAAGIVSERNDYYPFGLRHANAAYSLNANNRFKFNGKEEQVAGNPALLDYGARMYDNTLGRWTTVDPLAEKYFDSTPYGYAGNNPVKYIDPNGMELSSSAQEWMDKLLKEVQRRSAANDREIARREAKQAAGEGNAERLGRQIDRLRDSNAALGAVQSEIGALASSNQMYDVKIDNSLRTTDATGITETGKSVFNFETGNFEITIPDNASMAIVSHEFKHAYQFEVGEFSSGYGGRPFYDQHDEIAGYARGAMFGGPTHTLQTLPEYYKQLAVGPISATNHSYFKHLLNHPQVVRNTVNDRRNGISAFRINGVTYYTGMQ